METNSYLKQFEGTSRISGYDIFLGNQLLLTRTKMINSALYPLGGFPRANIVKIRITKTLHSIAHAINNINSGKSEGLCTSAAAVFARHAEYG